MNEYQVSRLTRRRFLQLSSTAAIASTILPGGLFGKGKAKRCIIIGAGLAGLSAAYKLKQSGWDVVILDARERLGGRVYSYVMPESTNLICELGAEWIGASHERMIALCKEFKIPLQDHRFESWLLQDGKVSAPGKWGFSPAADAAFARLMKDFHSMTEEQKAKLDERNWWRELEKIGFTQEDLILRDLMDSTDFGESIRHVSAFAAAAEYAESSPANEMDFKMTGGNSRLVGELAKRIGQDNIRLQKFVQSVTEKDGVVTVKAGDETFEGDACICTVPATMLTKITFDPPLPEAQFEAAQQLEYSRIAKNSVLYKDRFWKNPDFALVSDLTSHFYFHSTQNQPGVQGILTAYAVGEKADVLAAQGERRRMEIITEDLRDFEPDAMEKAISIVSYPWQRDKFTLGAYALYRPGQWFTIRSILAEPHGKVLFAGEHIADWQGFMEGAVNTGEAAAQTLIS